MTREPEGPYGSGVGRGGSDRRAMERRSAAEAQAAAQSGMQAPGVDCATK